MTFEDWATNYSSLYVCRTFPDSWKTHTVAGRWKGESAGGCRNFDTSYKNPHFLIKVSKPCTVHISQLVEDSRGRTDVEAQCHGHVVYDRPVNGQAGGYPIKDVYGGQKFGGTGAFAWGREVSCFDSVLCLSSSSSACRRPGPLLKVFSDSANEIKS